MPVMYKGLTFLICPGPHEFLQRAFWQYKSWEKQLLLQFLQQQQKCCQIQPQSTYFGKIFCGGMPPDPPKREQALHTQYVKHNMLNHYCWTWPSYLSFKPPPNPSNFSPSLHLWNSKLYCIVLLLYNGSTEGLKQYISYSEALETHSLNLNITKWSVNWLIDFKQGF